MTKNNNKNTNKTSPIICLTCKNPKFLKHKTYWECKHCKQQYVCTNGIPDFSIKSKIRNDDKHLMDSFYNNLFGRFYNFFMPFLSLPVRPIKISIKYWLAYFFIVLYLMLVVGYSICWLVYSQHCVSITDIFVGILLISTSYILYKHKYIFYLLVLAIPTKISLFKHQYKPTKTFTQIHSEFQKEYQNSTTKLKMLDIATGTCNSLFRHGWMNLNAEYTGVDLSKQMLTKGQKIMNQQHVPVTLLLADAHKLPFESETFDIVTNYGAINSCANTKVALEEMVRVTKKGGKILFLDEQLYNSASFIEKLYFKFVLSNHNVIHHCPIEFLPKNIEEIQVDQIYQFYYICTARKSKK